MAPRSRFLLSVLAPVALVCLMLGASRAAADASLGESVALLDAALAKTPGDPILWQRRAALERRRGNRARAFADLARAGELGLAPSLLGRDRAGLLVDEGRIAEAEVLLRSAREGAPEDVTILLPHARALAALGRWRPAADAYAEIVRLAPDASPDVHLERARALGAAGPAAAGEAIAALDEAMARLGAAPALAQEALALELSAGRIDAALARLDRMASAASRPERLLVQRAGILEAAGRHAEAAAAYGAALAAMDSLPPQRRTTPAAAELERHAQSGVARIAARGPGEGR